MAKQKILPTRITIPEALQHMRPLGIGKSSFYGSRERPGPRWTLIDQLDIREGPPLTMDRQRFFAWLRSRAGERATRPSPRVLRLGTHGMPDNICRGSAGEQLAILCRALEAGRITLAEFERAKQDLALQSRGSTRR